MERSCYVELGRRMRYMCDLPSSSYGRMFEVSVTSVFKFGWAHLIEDVDFYPEFNVISLFYLLGIFQTAQWETAVSQNSEKSLDFADMTSIEFGHRELLVIIILYEFSTYELSKLKKRNFCVNL